MDDTGTAPTSARIALIGGSITLSSVPTTAVRTTASRTTPSGPDKGVRPSPKGGTPGARSGGVYGAKHAHGMSPASADDSAPQQFTSSRSASGLTRAIASARSGTSYPARCANADTESFSAARGLAPFQSSSSI